MLCRECIYFRAAPDKTPWGYDDADELAVCPATGKHAFGCWCIASFCEWFRPYLATGEEVLAPQHQGNVKVSHLKPVGRA